MGEPLFATFLSEEMKTPRNVGSGIIHSLILIARALVYKLQTLNHSYHDRVHGFRKSPNEYENPY